jgi:penicillin-binding protein activator
MLGKLFLATLVSALAGCAAPPRTVLIDERADTSAVGVGLDMRDFDLVAGDAVQSMLASPAMTKPSGGRYVMAISRITNDTMQRIDTDLLIKKIRVDLLNSGKVVITTAVGAVVEDPLAMQTRQLRGSQEFNQAQVAKTGQMIAPDLSLSGTIIQQNARLSDGTQRVEYSFQLAVTDVRTGLAVWEGEKPIRKLTTGGATW